jgi:hypothetical protein
MAEFFSFSSYSVVSILAKRKKHSVVSEKKDKQGSPIKLTEELTGSVKGT